MSDNCKEIPSLLTLKFPDVNIYATNRHPPHQSKGMRKCGAARRRNKRNADGEYCNKSKHLSQQQERKYRAKNDQILNGKYCDKSKRFNQQQERKYREKNDQILNNWRLDWKPSTQHLQLLDDASFISLNGDRREFSPAPPLSSSAFYKFNFADHLRQRDKRLRYYDVSSTSSSTLPSQSCLFVNEVGGDASREASGEIGLASVLETDKEIVTAELDYVECHQSNTNLPENTMEPTNRKEPTAAPVQHYSTVVGSAEETAECPVGDANVLSNCDCVTSDSSLKDVSFVNAKFKDFVDSFTTYVREESLDQTSRDTLRNSLWELLKEKFTSFASQSHLDDVESRLSNLEHLHESSRSRKRRRSEGTTSGDDFSSDEEIKILEEFSTKHFSVMANGVSIKKEKVDASEETSRKKSKKKNKRQLCEDAEAKPRNLQFLVDPVGPDSLVKVYTSGVISEDTLSCGIGVWFGEEHVLNVSHRISNEAMNHKTLYLQAVWIAVQIAKNAGLLHLMLHTSSSHVLRVIRRLQIWKERGWKKKSGEYIKNKNQIKQLRKAISSLNIDWKLVPSHHFVLGAEKARQLAFLAVS